MTEEEDLKRIFFLECEELLGSAESSVESLRSEASAEAINALFRSVHSVKGGAGAFGMDRLAKFAHAFESFMDLLRKGKAELDQAALGGGQRALAVDRVAEAVDHAAEQALADRHVDDGAGALHRVAFLGEGRGGRRGRPVAARDRRASRVAPDGRPVRRSSPR